MLLSKDGVTFDVSHPVEIARLKKAGYTEVKTEKPARAEKPAEQGKKTA